MVKAVEGRENSFKIPTEAGVTALYTEVMRGLTTNVKLTSA